MIPRLPTARTHHADTLVRIFTAVLAFTSESPSDSVVSAADRDGAYIGSGSGSVSGDRVRGTMSWSLYAGDCLYPSIRRGEAVPDAVHLCTLSPGGFINTEDGVRIRFEGRGYGWQVRIRGHSPLDRAHVLPVPLPSQKRNSAGSIEHLAGELEVEVRRHGKPVWSDRSPLAALEHGGLDRAEAELRRRGVPVGQTGAAPVR